MHSLRLWTLFLKTVGRINLNRRISTCLASESKLLIRRTANCCQVDYQFYVLGRTNKFLIINDRNVTNQSSAVEGTSQTHDDLLEKLVVRVNADITRLRRVNRSNVERLLQELEKRDVHQGYKEVEVLLLQCCGNLLPDEHPSARMNLVREVWKKLHDLGVSFSVEHYNALLTSYVENGIKIQVEEFLAKMGNVKPDERTYQLLLACVCEAGDLDQAVDIISRMKSGDFPASEAIFNSLILGHARAGDLISASAVLDTMRTARVTPSVNSFTALMKGYVEVGEVANVFKVRQAAEASFISLDMLRLMEIIKSAVLSGNEKLIPEVLKLVPAASIDLSPPVINMLAQLVHLGYETIAFSLLRAVPPESDFVTKGDSYSFGAFFIREMVKKGTPAETMVEMCDTLAAEGRNSRALHKATEIALVLGKAELALMLLHALKARGAPIRPHYFWPIFLSFGRKEGERGVLSGLDRMQELGVDVDYDTIADYVLPRMSCNDPEFMIQKLQAHGLQLSDLLTPVVALLLKESRIKAALVLCRRLKSSLDTERLLHLLVEAYLTSGDVTSTVGLLKILGSSATREKRDWAGDFILEILVSTKSGNKNVDTLLKEYQRAGLPISSFAGDIISKYTVRNSPAECDITNTQALVESLIHSGLNASADLVGQQIPHPRDMGLEELECHLVELKSKNLNTRGVLRRLLQLYCREGKLNKALEVKTEFEAAGYEFSAGMLASLFDLHVRLQQLDEAERFLAELLNTSPNFSLDDHKILDFAALLVTNGKYRGAVAILQKHADLQGVKGSRSIVRNCWKLLQAVAEKGEPQRVKHMLELLVTLGYCEISNIVLGPLIRVHINQGSLQGAVEEYKRCVVEHHKTPLQHELLCQLLAMADQPDNDTPRLLEEVLEATRSVHGTPNTNVALVVALAESGKIRQLQKLVLETPLNLKSSVLMARCRRLAEEGKITALKNLANVSKGIQNFNSSALYFLMLKVYSQRGDCDGALSVWTALQEQDIQPPEAFLNSLANLLRSNKREVPFSVPGDLKRS